mmetsp:Transcript_73979/g.192619  ORF Transcript_73979/g.192619 Transcript_73979/m.192619 type:complete len:174 (+) Transcript_73979:530-1051(+)
MRRWQSQVVVAEALTLISESPTRRPDGSPPRRIGIAVGDAAAAGAAPWPGMGVGAAVSPSPTRKRTSPSSSPMRKRTSADIDDLLSRALSSATGVAGGAPAAGFLPTAHGFAARRATTVSRDGGGGGLGEDSLSRALSTIGVDPKVVLAKADALWEERVRKAVDAPAAGGRTS